MSVALLKDLIDLSAEHDLKHLKYNTSDIHIEFDMDPALRQVKKTLEFNQTVTEKAAEAATDEEILFDPMAGLEYNETREQTL